MNEPLTREERDLVLLGLILEARITGQSIMDCSRRGPDMEDQLKTAKVKESGLLKVIRILSANASLRGSASESSGGSGSRSLV